MMSLSGKNVVIIKLNRCKRLNEETKLELMAFSNNIAEVKMTECLSKFNETMTQLKSNRQFKQDTINLDQERFEH